MSNEEKSNTSPTDAKAKLRRERREKFQRIGFSVNETAKMVGKSADALRREIERLAVVEGDERVARLVAGIVARKRKDGGRWLVLVPAELRA